MICEICGCRTGRWLSVSDVAEQFGCCAKLVRRLIQEGQIDGFRFGGIWRVDHRSLDDYVLKESGRFPPRDPQARPDANG